MDKPRLIKIYRDALDDQRGRLAKARIVGDWDEAQNARDAIVAVQDHLRQLGAAPVDAGTIDECRKRVEARYEQLGRALESGNLAMVRESCEVLTAFAVEITSLGGGTTFIVK